MTREEIIETLKDMLDATGLGHFSNQPECIAINAAIDAINQFAEDNNAPDKQPDTITGLAPRFDSDKATLHCHTPGEEDVVIEAEKDGLAVLRDEDGEIVGFWKEVEG